MIGAALERAIHRCRLKAHTVLVGAALGQCNSVGHIFAFAHIGTAINDPNVDFSKIAQGMGWHAEGPITDPKDLAPAIARAIKVVESGQPALVDTWMQPR